MMEEGIVFKVGTTDFDDAIRICEHSFFECSTHEWHDVKESKDFQKLSDFLTAYDIDNEVFRLKK